MIVILLNFILHSSFSLPVVVEKKRNLLFGTIVAGDPSHIVAPDNITKSSAKFRITGDPKTLVNVMLPVSCTITKGGNGNWPINVTNFTANNLNPKLNKKGKFILYVGATLDSIPLSQKSGNYKGSFLVDVIY